MKKSVRTHHLQILNEFANQLTLAKDIHVEGSPRSAVELSSEVVKKPTSSLSFKWAKKKLGAANIVPNQCRCCGDYMHNRGWIIHGSIVTCLKCNNYFNLVEGTI